jgi:ribosomal protein S18 acetylase RimI-like enzyme
MNLDTNNVYLSAIDEERFGMTTARVSNVTLDGLSTIIDFCYKNNVVFLISRCLTSEIKVAQEMEKNGFRIMDTLVYYSFNLLSKPIPEDTNNVLIRPIRLGEENDAAKVSAEAFQGYHGHYHADDKLNRTKCDEAYMSWAYNSCISRDYTNEVLVAEINRTIVGIHTLRMNNPDEGELILVCTSPKFQGHGIYKSFIIQGMRWCLERKAKTVILSTQTTNIAVQKVWVRLGFEPINSFYTFHKWFNE